MITGQSAQARRYGEMMNSSMCTVLAGFWGLLIMANDAAAAQISEFQGKRVVEIQFSPSQTLDPDDLAKAQPVKVGEPFRAEEVANAIDGLFATGRFEDIIVEAEPTGDGVIVRFITQTIWFLGG